MTIPWGGCVLELISTLAPGSAAATFRYSGHSDTGSVRHTNEDSFLSAPPLFVVADGMGGHQFGDRASQAAVATIAAAFPQGISITPAQVLGTIREANLAVLALTAGTEAVSGTTLTGVAFVEVGSESSPHWMAFNVGDSRVYSWDGRTLEQLTVDHSAVQEMVDQGVLTRVQADRHPDRNIVTKALGASTEVDPDVWLFPARGEQTFVLCSDGLTKELGDDEIARIIVFHAAEGARQSDGPPISLAERLVNAAIAAGGSDNVTVVVVTSQLSATDRATETTVDRDALSALLEETRPRG